MASKALTIQAEYNEILRHVTVAERKLYTGELEAYRESLRHCGGCGSAAIMRQEETSAPGPGRYFLVCQSCGRKWPEPEPPVFSLRRSIVNFVRPFHDYFARVRRNAAITVDVRRSFLAKPDLLRTFHAESVIHFLKKHDDVLTGEVYRDVARWPIEYYYAWGCKKFESSNFVLRFVDRFRIGA